EAVRRYRTLATLPFDHDRRMVSVLVDDQAGQRMLISKGAPESVLDRCVDVPESARRALDAEFDAGSRVVAVASRRLPGHEQLTAADERDFTLDGFLVFLDAPKTSAVGALQRLAGLGLTVKVVTGDNPKVA